MTGALGLWWVWLAAGLALGLAEVLLPGFIFLGFAIAAVFMAGVVAFVPGLGAPALLAVFGVFSVFSWIALRFVFKRQSSDARIVTKDVNDH